MKKIGNILILITYIRIYKCTLFIIQYVVDAPQRKQHLDTYNNYSLCTLSYSHH